MKKLIKDTKLFIRQIFLFCVDMAVISCVGIAALLLRFDLSFSKIEGRYLEVLWSYLPIMIISTVIVFFIFKLYHSLWIFAGITELQNIITACVITTVIQFFGLRIKGLYLPRSFYPLFGVCLLLATMGTRFTYRFLRINIRKRENKKLNRKVMIVGAGEAANVIIKEILSSEHVHITIKCIVDDAPEKLGKYIHGIKVMGNRNNIISLVNRYGIDEIIIAMPSVSRKITGSIIEICKETKCELKILPGMYQFMNNEVSFSQLRSVDVEDLLGREPIEVNLDSIMQYVNNKVILITGGGGSIGSELCRQIAGHKPKRLIIVDIYENNAYSIQQELKLKYPELDMVVLIASVRNTKRLDRIFRQYRPNIVYHAAAHKHVPLMEDSPNEAIKNNVFGTLKTVKAADKYGVERFVLISTDKAVNPTNIMGASKRICEMMIQMYNNRSKTEYVAVRFGNVLESNGSVIPLFKKQITMGGPVTVTHPDIIRYFMTIPEAVSLVLQAGVYAKGGEIFILEMGEPVKILDLACNLIRLSGYAPYEDIPIVFTGLRPGEKLYEELLLEEEGTQETQNKLIHIGKPIEMNEIEFEHQLEVLHMASTNEESNIREYIKKIVPTYTPMTLEQ